jgi:hypothetical protein
MMPNEGTQRAPKKWTLMVYLAGDNNLESFGQADLEEMKAVGSTDAFNVVAQFDRMSDGVTRRFYLTNNRSLSADIVAELPETNTGDPEFLFDFIRWGLAEYPAHRTALILWNHGAGWKDDDIYSGTRKAGLSESRLPTNKVRWCSQRGVGRSLFATSVQTISQYPAAVRAILFDDTSKDFLDNQELKQVLDRVVSERRGQKLDLIGFDACLMNMIEVACQIQGTCDYMVGSQEIEPGDGWPYDRILKALASEPDAPTESLARVIVDTYTDHYLANPSQIAVTQSAVRLQQVPVLVGAVGRLADSLTEHLNRPAFVTRVLLPALRYVRKFRDQQYIDLGHLGELLAARAEDGRVAEVALDIVARLNPASRGSVVTAARSIAPHGALLPGPNLQPCNVDINTGHSSRNRRTANGLSIYLPFLGPVSPAYAGLEFARNCSWPRFLNAFSET